eukprot:scaffold1395_cov397-Prasinococcus_capsulatus_cf.AAC.4
MGSSFHLAGLSKRHPAHQRRIASLAPARGRTGCDAPCQRAPSAYSSPVAGKTTPPQPTLPSIINPAGGRVRRSPRQGVPGVKGQGRPLTRHERMGLQGKEKRKRAVPHGDFQAGHPCQYYSRSLVLNCRDRTRTGVFTKI